MGHPADATAASTTEDQAEKKRAPPEDAIIPELPRASRDTRSRAGRHQIKPNQVKRTGNWKVKPTALRVENMAVARVMLGRVVRSGELRFPSVVHMSNIIVKLPIGARHTWLQATV